MFSNCHNCPAGARQSSARATVALVGNPNTGKTTLFNSLTGLRQRTGNYPGVTVEKKVGRLDLPSQCRIRRAGSTTPHPIPNSEFRVPNSVDLLDLPGTYSLAACSPDEMIVADMLLGQASGQPLPDAVIVVADASRLERNLFLVTQVIECGRPTVLALNMMDVAEQSGLRIDVAALGRELGCQIVPIVASRGKGLAELRAAVADATALPPPEASRANAVPLPPPVEQALVELQGYLDSRREQLGRPVHRVEAMRVLLDRQSPAEQRLAVQLSDGFVERLSSLRNRLTGAGLDLDMIEPAARYDYIAGIVSRCVGHGPAPAGRRLADRVDHVLLHPVLGVLLFIVVMAAMFQAIYLCAAPMMDGIDAFFGWLARSAGAALGHGLLSHLICDGLIAGVGAVLVFLPQVLILFAIIAVLEDCGYMARAAVVMDRLLARCGLSGRSFVPMLSCFACTVPGIMAARVIDNRRDRIATILVSPLLSCSARLPVYVLLIAAFIPNTRVFGLIGLQGLTLFGLYSLGIVLAIPMAALFKRTLLRGQTPPFVMEMPAFRRPSLKVMAVRVLDHGRDFLVRAGTVILLVTLIVWALSYWPRPASIAAEHDRRRSAAREQLAGESLDAELSRIDASEAGDYMRQSFLARAGRAIEPAVRPLGWDWRIGTAVLASFPAREIVVSTLGTLYNVGDAESDGGSTSLQDALRRARDDRGRPAMTPLVALGLMVFMALCCQCAATLAVIRRETGSWRWAAVTFIYMTALAYGGALLVRQVGLAMGYG